MTPDEDDHPAQPSSPRRGVPKIVWVIPISAVLIVLLIVLRSTYGPLWRPGKTIGFQPRPAPAIVLQDQHGKRHRTERYLGRRKMVVLFFDGNARPDEVRQLAMLRDAYPQIRAANAEIVAVSAAPPESMAERGGGSIPFPILADVDYAAHRQWGVSVAESGPLMPVLFLVDTNGVIRGSHEFVPPNTPIDLPALLDQIAQLP